jgi:hypothetical protein
MKRSQLGNSREFSGVPKVGNFPGIPESGISHAYLYRGGFEAP